MRYCDKHIMIVLMLLLVPIYLISCSGNASTSLPSSNSTLALNKGEPTNVTAVGSDSRVVISWESPQNAITYHLYWNTTGGVTKDSNKIRNVYIPFDHRDLMNGKTYYYRVSAVYNSGESGESDLSVEVQATPMLPFTKILTKLTDPDAEIGDEFGYSVAIDGNFAIVGAWLSHAPDPNNYPIPYAGAAYVFQRSDTGVWDPAGAKLTAPDAAYGDQFGFAVSISGNYAIVSALFKDGGAAYIFQRTLNTSNTNTWAMVAKFVDPVPEAGSHRFGTSVSISGEYAVVGENSYSGSVHIYQRTGTNNWVYQTTLTSPAGALSGQFGISVALSGDYLIVGDFHEDNDQTGIPEVGAAYIFHRRTINGVDDWTQYSKIKPHDGAEYDCFGISVAISGDYAVVGALGKDGNTGAAYVFHRLDENFWDEGPKLVAPDAQADDAFGMSVAITDKYVLVGAYGENCGWDENIDEGAAYVFRRIGANTWDGGTKITIPEGDIGDKFGYAVAISGESAIIGALGDDGSTNGVFSAGAVYVY